MLPYSYPPYEPIHHMNYTKEPNFNTLNDTMNHACTSMVEITNARTGGTI